MARLNTELRSHESPMDFTWQEGRGPAETDSPFLRATANNVPYKDSFAGQKRSSSQLDSPTKASLPGLRKPEGQTWLFSSTPSTKPPVQLRNPSFTTPQRPIDTDFSSGPDQSSPMNADSEDTPEPPTRKGLSKGDGALIHFEGSKSAKKPSSSGLFGRYTSSGRGEIATRKSYTDVLSRKVHKRRRRDTDRDVRFAPRRSSEDSDFEERPSSSEDPRQGQRPPVQQMGFVPSVLTFIDAHPSLPSTLSFYVQFFLNLFFAFCLMYVLYGVFSTIRHDIDEKAMMESSEILAEMAVCARGFKENKCERDSRVPAMETVCNNWEKCMQRDPYKVGRSRLSAGMFAEIFNSFIEPISIKAIVVSVSVIIGCFAVNNLTFGMYRKSHQPPPAPYMHQPPQQQQMGYPPNNEHYYTPYQHQIGMQGTNQGGYALEGQSPTKRLGYQ